MLKILNLFAVSLLLACGEAVCAKCRSDAMCKPETGEVCLQAGPSKGTCGRQCSLQVWHTGDWETPCDAGVGKCPETCADEAGVFGHCTPAPGLGLPDGVGLCHADAGELVCPDDGGGT
jgi:hypothetical protein